MKQIDRIRNMNAEELAEHLWNFCNDCIYKNAETSVCESKCYDVKKTWLESEVEE